MISQTLMDKLQQLRLPAFRDGLQEQLSNPQYIDLSFEERLLLLVDMEVLHFILAVLAHIYLKIMVFQAVLSTLESFLP